MALIRINIADTLLSESAAKKPAYHIVQSSSGPMIVIDSKHKPVVTKAVTSLASAKKLGLSAAKLSQATEKLKLKLKSTRDAGKKGPLRDKIKANNATIKKDVAAAKKLAKDALSSLAKAGLKVLDPTVRPTYITSTQPDYTIGNIGKAKTNSFWVKASGTHRAPSLLKPRYATGEKFDKIGASPAAKKLKPGTAPNAKAKPKPKNENSLWRHYDKSSGPKGEQYKTEGQLRDAARQSLQAQSRQWDKDTRMSKRMLKELNGGKAITSAAGWTGTVEKGKGVFTNKKGQKLVVKKSDMARFGLTPDSFKRALGESNITDTNW